MKSIFFVLALISSTAFAADVELLRCLAIPDSPARLACYDGLATALRDTRAGPAPGVAATAAAAAQNFGRPPAPLGQPAAAELLESRIDGPLAGWQRDTQIRLVNGQVWQIGGETASFAPLSSPKVVIHPGLFGSYFLEVEGLNFQVRVKRLR